MNFCLRFTKDKHAIQTRNESPSWLHDALLKSFDLEWGQGERTNEINKQESSNMSD